MILQLDLGNSALKWRCGSESDVLGRGCVPLADGLRLPEIDAVPREVWIASVRDAETNAALSALVQERWAREPWFAESAASACGLTNSYREPARMGVDRWLAMIAAWQHAGGPVCVVDAGSATTIDFVDTAGVHRGGYILPGLAMMERALLGQTARVRFGDAPRDRMEPGTSTEAAVFNGLQLAQVGAVATALDRYGAGETLVFTGGGGAVAMGLLGRGGEFLEDLVLDGLLLLGREVRRAEERRA